MKRVFTIIILVALVALLIPVFVSATKNKPGTAESNIESEATRPSNEKPENKFPKMNEKMNDLKLQTINRDVTSLYKLDKQYKVINLWASWCPPCKEEMPFFQDAFNKYGDKVCFIMINAASIDDLSASDRYLREHQYDFPVYYDFGGTNLDYLTHGTGSIPQTYVIDKDNNVIFAQAGVLDSKAKAEIMQLISK